MTQTTPQPEQPALTPDNRRVDYLELIQGKHIAIVGGAHDARKDPKVYSADLVVFCNDTWFRFGDILHDKLAFYTVNSSLERYERIPHIKERMRYWNLFMFNPQAQAAAAWATTNNIPWAFYGLNEYILHNNLMPSQAWIEDLAAIIQAFPCTGTSALFHVLMHEPASVYATGVDFYKQPNGDYPEKIGVHFIKPQIAYYAQLAYTNSKVSFSEQIWEAIFKLYDTKWAEVTEDLRKVVNSLYQKHGVLNEGHNSTQSKLIGAKS